MRWTTALAAVFLAAGSGCQDFPSSPWGRSPVPITKPSEVSYPPSAETAPASEPATQPNEPATRPTVLSSPKVLAGATLQVNRRFLTVGDILRAACFELAKIPKDLPEATFRQRAQKVLTDEIRRQVSQLLALPEAERILTEDQTKLINQEVDATLAEMVSQAGGSRKKLEADLIAQGTTLEEVLEGLRREMRVRAFLRMKFFPAVSISRAMLWDYYSRHREQFVAVKKVQMQIIAVPWEAFVAAGSGEPSPSERAAAKATARARIDEAATALARGEDFAKVARRLSMDPKAADGGLWPLMPADSFRQEKVEQAAFGQPYGWISDVIETDEGFTIVRTAAVEEAQATRFEDAQADIEKKLRDQQAAKLYAAYFDQLLQGATIAQSESFLPTAVDRAVARYHALD